MTSGDERVAMTDVSIEDARLEMDVDLLKRAAVIIGPQAAANALDDLATLDDPQLQRSIGEAERGEITEIGNEAEFHLDIKLPEGEPERVEALRAKLKEYAARAYNNRYRAPDSPGAFLDACKREILRRVLTYGQINSGTLIGELVRWPGFNVQDFEQALTVIDDYCTTGGQNVIGGLSPRET
ncbi:hypothetical protein HYW35_04205 [Candidatus Saccharibacteria bacterium]|nr:hypothetical protein [Candidatus Saccharibacteria bacterium]